MKNEVLTIQTNPGDTMFSTPEQAGREIYENITQCLCLARLCLAGVTHTQDAEILSRIGEAHLLIGKAVKDLRNIAKALASFHTADKSI